MIYECVCTRNCFCTGQTFRVILDRIGELRSILPDGVYIRALTATATKPLRFSVAQTIGMRDPYIAAISPCKRT